jgi:putative membrane protein insertion efficiency factor
MENRPAFNRLVGMSAEYRLGWLSFAALAVIRVYQAILSPNLFLMTGPACRFEPTCSAYAGEAIARYGIIRGSWMALKRLARCNPFGAWGFDPLPTTQYVNDLTVTGVETHRDRRNFVGQ